MLDSSPIPKQTVGRTFFIAITLLGVVALVQLGAVGWVFLVHFHATSPVETGVVMRAAETPPEETKELKLTDSFAPDTTPAQSLPNPTPISKGPPMKPVSPSLGHQTDLADQAKMLRDRGDMSTALTKLREAQAISPDNPLIISEMAITYEKMGLSDKALEQWRRIYDMGESAGIYYAAADAKLKSVAAPAAASGKNTADGFQSGSTMALVDVTKIDSADAPDKKFTLRIPVKARPGTKIDVRDVVIQVFFYDTVEDSVLQTDANITYRWTTLPVDWSDSDIEILEVDYAARSLNPKEKVSEKRKYYGYIVRVYYKNELQDMRADPVKLLQQYPPPVTLSSEETK